MRETIGLISGLIVTASVIPYAVRVWQRKIVPNLVSWSIWTIIGLALLVTYKSSGAQSNVWPAVFGFTNPLLVSILLIWRGERKKPEWWEWMCLVFALVSLGIWAFVYDDPELAQWALYLAIVADGGAAIPTIIFVWSNPHEDRPFAWTLFAVGYALVIFAIGERTVANYILPLYMAMGALLIAFPLARWRWRTRVPLKEWI